MNVRRYGARIDEVQQHHTLLAFPLAVFKKFGDDEGGNLAALIAYYGFLSLFPLLLVLFTVLGFALHGHTGLQHDLKTSALADFPVIGDQISRNVTSVRGSGVGLAVGIAGTLWGGLGIANAAQHAMNQVWNVPRRARPGFVARVARSLAVVGTIGLGIIFTTVVGAVGSGRGGMAPSLRAGALMASIALNVGLFVAAFRILTAADIGWRDLLPGAVFAAFAWEALQALGGLYVAHGLRGMSQTYGFFAIVLGLLSWIFLQAQVLVYAAEINAVRARRLWPRSLVPPPTTPADRRARRGDADGEMPTGR